MGDELTKEELEGLAYNPSASDQLRLSLTSDIILQSILPRDGLKDDTERRLYEFVGQAFVRWVDAEIKASKDAKAEGPASVVLHSGKMLDGITAITAAFMAYGAGVLIRPSDHSSVMDTMYGASRKTANRALEHCEKVFKTVLAGIAVQAGGTQQ